MIRHANVYKSFYYLQSFPIFDQDFISRFVLSYKQVGNKLWHYRLGHPRHKIIEQICKFFSYV